MRATKVLLAGLAGFVGSTIVMVVALLMASGLFGPGAAEQGALPGFVLACLAAVAAAGWAVARTRRGRPRAVRRVHPRPPAAVSR